MASLCFGSLAKAVGVDDTIFLFEDLELPPKLHSKAWTTKKDVDFKFYGRGLQWIGVFQLSYQRLFLS